jgi:hypothetical protein
MDGRVSIPGRARDFSLLRSVQLGYRANPASYDMANESSFPESKAAKA